MYYIYNSHYHGYDWHDFKSWNSYLGKKEDKYAVNPKDFVELVKQDILKSYELTQSIIDQIQEKVQMNTETTIVDDMVQIIIKAQSDEITMDYDWCGFSSQETYVLKDIKNPVYLPTEEFVGFDKMTSGCERCYTTYFEDFDQAIQYLGNITSTQEQISPFTESKKTLLIGEKIEFDDNEWYQEQQQIIEVTAGNPKNYSSWHPLPSFQMVNLGLRTEEHKE